MANHKQILEQMLRDGNITPQQSEYVQNLLRNYPDHDIDDALEKAKERFSDAPDENDTLDFETLKNCLDRKTYTTTQIELATTHQMTHSSLKTLRK